MLQNQFLFNIWYSGDNASNDNFTEAPRDCNSISYREINYTQQLTIFYPQRAWITMELNEKRSEALL